MATTSRKKSPTATIQVVTGLLDSMRSGQSVEPTSSTASRHTSFSDASKTVLGASTSGISLVSAKIITTMSRRTEVATGILTCTGGPSTGSRTSSNTKRRLRESKLSKCQSATRAKRVVSVGQKTRVSVLSVACTCVKNTTTTAMRSTLT